MSQVDMPTETHQLATAVLASWAAIRMKTQADCGHHVCATPYTVWPVRLQLQTIPLKV